MLAGPNQEQGGSLQPFKMILIFYCNLFWGKAGAALTVHFNLDVGTLSWNVQKKKLYLQNTPKSLDLKM